MADMETKGEFIVPQEVRAFLAGRTFQDALRETLQPALADALAASADGTVLGCAPLTAALGTCAGAACEGAELVVYTHGAAASTRLFSVPSGKLTVLAGEAPAGPTVTAINDGTFHAGGGNVVTGANMRFADAFPGNHVTITDAEGQDVGANREKVWHDKICRSSGPRGNGGQAKSMPRVRLSTAFDAHTAEQFDIMPCDEQEERYRKRTAEPFRQSRFFRDCKRRFTDERRTS